jgi:hypothetical protein
MIFFESANFLTYVQMPSGGVRAPLSEDALKEKHGFAYEAPEDNETDCQRHNRLRRMRHRARHTAGPRAHRNVARLTESELQALHGPHYEEPQDGETEVARRNRLSRMRRREQWANAQVSSRAGASAAERDDASNALPPVALHPLRADPQLAKRRQRIADALRDECRQWSVAYDFIDLGVPQHD